MTPERIEQLREQYEFPIFGDARNTVIVECLDEIERLQGGKARKVALTLTATGDADVVLLCSRDGRYVHAAIHVDALQGLESLGDGEYSCDWWRRNLPLDVVLMVEDKE